MTGYWIARPEEPDLSLRYGQLTDQGHLHWEEMRHEQAKTEAEAELGACRQSGAEIY